MAKGLLKSKKPGLRKSVKLKKLVTRVGGKKSVKKSVASKIVPAKGALVATLRDVTQVQFTANSQAMLVARAEKKSLTLWDVASGEETPPLKPLAKFSAMALSADNRLIAMGSSTGIIAVESTQTGKVLWKTKADGVAVTDIVVTLDGALVIAAGSEWLRIHDAKTGVVNAGFDAVQGASCPHVALSPDGLFMAHSEVHSHSVLVWHLPSRQVGQFIKLKVPMGKIRRLAFGPTVRQLFVAQEKQVSGWNGETGQAFVEFGVEGADSLAVVEGGDVLATTRVADGKDALDVWSAATGRLRRSVGLPGEELGELAASPDGRLLALPGGRECWVWRAAKLAAI